MNHFLNWDIENDLSLHYWNIKKNIASASSPLKRAKKNVGVKKG